MKRKKPMEFWWCQMCDTEYIHKTTCGTVATGCAGRKEKTIHFKEVLPTKGKRK